MHCAQQWILCMENVSFVSFGSWLEKPKCTVDVMVHSFQNPLQLFNSPIQWIALLAGLSHQKQQGVTWRKPFNSLKLRN